MNLVDIDYLLRHQRTPGVHTYSPCDCGRSTSRSGRSCVECLLELRATMIAAAEPCKMRWCMTGECYVADSIAAFADWEVMAAEHWKPGVTRYTVVQIRGDRGESRVVYVGRAE